MTKKEVLMPKLGESVTEGTINHWLVKVGDQVNKYDPIADVMTDKVNAEVPSSYTGTIVEIIADEGETVEVGSLICYIETEVAEGDIGAPNDMSETEVETVSKDDSNLAKEMTSIEQPSTSETNEQKHEEDAHSNKSMKTRYSPAVLKLASEHDINLNSVNGTGMGGRITRKDIRQYIENVSAVDNSKVPEKARADQISEEKKGSITPLIKESKVGKFINEEGRTSEIPVTGVRKVIADKMVQSKTEIPHGWMTVEVDVTDLVTYRNKLKDEFQERNGYNLTYFAFFANIVAKALKEYPELNSTWDNDKIVQHHDVNLSIAVAHNNELFVPVIKHANEKSITGIAKEINKLAKKARTNKLTTEDMQAGTFTLNNTGTFGSISSMGIINHPQAAILQVESIVKRPVIINDMFAARDIVNLSLSLDHRILDGLICGRFLQRVRELLENINEKTTLI